MAWVIDLDNTPRVLSSADLAATNLDNVLGADDGEGHETSELSILLDGVDGDSVVFDILHNQLLGLSQLLRSE